MTLDEFIEIKQAVKQVERDVRDLKHEIHGNGKDGIKTTLTKVHTTQKMMMWVMPSIFSFLVAVVQIILQILNL